MSTMFTSVTLAFSLEAQEMQSKLSKVSKKIRMPKTIRIVGMLVNSWVRVPYNSLSFL